MYTTVNPEDLIRQRTELLLREVRAERLGSKLRTRRGPRLSAQWLVAFFLPRRGPESTTAWPRWIG